MTFDDSVSSAGRHTVTKDARLSQLQPSLCRLAWVTRDLTQSAVPCVPSSLAVSCHHLSPMACYFKSAPGVKTTLLQRRVDALRLQESFVAEKWRRPLCSDLAPPRLECGGERRDGQVTVPQIGRHGCTENNEPLPIWAGEPKRDPRDAAL